MTIITTPHRNKLPVVLQAVKRCFRLLVRHHPPPHPPPTITTTSVAPLTTPISSSDASTDTPAKKSTKRPPNLHINISQQEQQQRPQPQSSVRYRATTTLREVPAPLKLDNGDGFFATALKTSTKKRGSLSINVPSPASTTGQRGTEYLRGISLGSGDIRGSLSITPKNFKDSGLSLSYDRSRMKNPATSGTPSPMEDGHPLKHVSSDDSYLPKITAQTKNWPSFLARNYYHFNNIKLCITFLINMLLLTYQVLPCPSTRPCIFTSLFFMRSSLYYLFCLCFDLGYVTAWWFNSGRQQHCSPPGANLDTFYTQPSLHCALLAVCCAHSFLLLPTSK